MAGNPLSGLPGLEDGRVADLDPQAPQFAHAIGGGRDVPGAAVPL
jgi:hypothetical protein